MGESVTLGNLLYFIKMKNEEFKKSAAETEEKLEGMQKKFDNNAKKMKTWGLAITGISAGVLTALQLMTKSTAEGVETLEKYSIATGMSTEQLQKWGYAAKLNKSSLDQLAQGLTFLARNMRSADLESQAAQQAFDELNIQTKDGQGNFRNLGDILDDIRERLSKMANGAEKTALVTKLFGRGAADLIPVLSLSKEQLDELSQEAERLGIILTTDNIAQFAKYKDTLEATEEGLSGLKMQIAAAVIPAMQDMISIVKNIIMWFNQLPEPIKKGIPQLALMAATIGMIVGPIMLVSSAWGKLKTLFLGMQIVNALRGIATGAITASGAVSILAASFSSFLIGGAIITGLIAIFGWYAKIREQARLAKVDISSISDLQELQNQKQFWNEELKRRQKGFETFKDTFPKMDPTARQKAYQPYNDAINEARRKQEEIAQREKDLLKEQGIGGDNFGNQFNIIDYLNNLNQKLLAVDKTAKAFGDTTNVAASKADLLKNAIIELIDNGVGPEDARIQKLVAQYKTYSAQADEVAEAEKRLEEQKKNQANATELVAAAQEKLGELYGVVISDNERFAQELEKMAAADGVLPEAAAQLKNLAAAFRRVDEEAENRTPFESWQKGLDESTKDWDNWGQHVEDIAAAAANGMEQSFSSFFTDALHGELKSIEDYFQSFLDSLVAAWSKAMAEMATYQIMTGAFGNWMRSLSGSGTSMPGNSGMEDPTLRASGGPVYTGKSYIVGENGPELLTMGPNSGYITPNNQLGAPNIQVNVINKGQELKTSEQSMEFDGEQYILNVVTEAATTNKGGLRDILQAK